MCRECFYRHTIHLHNYPKLEQLSVIHLYKYLFLAGTEPATLNTAVDCLATQPNVSSNLNDMDANLTMFKIELDALIDRNSFHYHY